MVKNKIYYFAGVIFCEIIFFMSCGPMKQTKSDVVVDDDSLEYEIVSEGHMTVFDKFRRISEDSTLTDTEKNKIHKTQIRNILRNK